MNRQGGTSGWVLVVDDHPDTLALQAMLLRREGYRVVTAATAEAALAVASEQPVDLLISDIRLPDRSGVELLQALRARGDLAGIAVSGHADDALVTECESAGFAQVLVKPLPPDQLVGAVKAILPLAQ